MFGLTDKSFRKARLADIGRTAPKRSVTPPPNSPWLLPCQTASSLSFLLAIFLTALGMVTSAELALVNSSAASA
jgi:hypothetical protein